ncbi:SDR family NAD(P)-dependent oxidoreductase [Fictibacillus phosphorivorans]|uniref:SDR family NAD(P)-dependent oxidoreductase n=1 Tax=Fictibacillus phosphorivorans TaxID=1221500 RepID=UPI003CF1ADEF
MKKESSGIMLNDDYMKCSILVRHNDFIVRDHQVHNVRVMPGVAFLELICRYLKNKGISPNNIQLRNILFKEPIVTSEKFDKKIEIIFERNLDFWEVVARSQKVREKEVVDPAWVENLRCELTLTNTYSEIQVNVVNPVNLIKIADRQEDMDNIYDNIKRSGIEHFEFMKLSGDVYETKENIIARLELSQLAKKYSDYFYFSPAFLDGATCLLGKLMEDFLNMENVEVTPFIPMFIDKFHTFHKLQDQCYVYLRKDSLEISKSGDIFYVDIQLYTETGELAAVYEKLGVKRVRSRGNIKVLEEIASKKDVETVPSNHVVDITETVITADTSVEMQIRKLIATVLQKNEDEVSLTEGFYNQGLNSTDLLKIVRKLEELTESKLYPTLLFEHSNIKSLAEFLSKYYHMNFESVGEKDKHSNLETENIYYEHVWERKDIKRNMAGLPKLSRVLVFSNNITAWESIVSKSDIVLVKMGQQFDFTNNVYSINPESKEDYRKLFVALQNQNWMPDRVIHSSSGILSNTHAQGSRFPKTDGFYSLLYLSQLIMEIKPKTNIPIIYVYERNGEEQKDSQAAISSLAKVISIESPKLICKVIEVINQTSSAETLFDIISKEFEFMGEESFVRYKNGLRFVRVLAELTENITDQTHNLPLKKQGVYLITGGLGGLGFIFAKYLAETLHAKLILVGRSSLTLEKQSMLTLLKSAGADAIYIQADIGNKEDINDAVNQGIQHFGHINGVIHAAGVIKDSLVLHKSKEDAESVMNPKVQGTFYLDKALKVEKLDFFVMFSSVTAVIGNIGQADYAYSNLYMDYFAEQRNKLVNKKLRNGKTLSINWPLWLEGGMDTNLQNEQLMRKNGLVPLSTEDGIKAFEYALTLSCSCLFVVNGNHELLKKASLFPIAKSPINQSRHQKKDDSFSTDGDIAIIGIGGRYPMANNVQEFWENLTQGKDCITEIPAERWKNEAYFHLEKGRLGTTYSKWGGFINDIDKFDPLFFNITPKEAELMDPQERLFLETVWQTLEDAAYTKEKLGTSKVGVYVGVMWGHYQLFHGEDNGQKYYPTSVYSAIANRVSYYFGFEGPSLAVDTMCSSSLTAIHLACESIRSGDCKLAIAGGVNITVHPQKYVTLSQGQFLSSDGRCRSFGAGGDGYVPGEGVGAILLKPLDKAIEDGDYIYGVIKGSSLNHGGRASGYHVPNPNAQAKLISNVLEKNKINPSTIGYIEAHGTGTSLGDPIEHQGLVKAFSNSEPGIKAVSIGSVKSNIGHLESAAGIAGITKILLQMKNKQIVPSLLHAERLNPNIDFKNSPFIVQQELSEWTKPFIVTDGKREKAKRRAGISSFGAGGSNAHIILEEYDSSAPGNEQPENGSFLFILSARTHDRLKQYANKVGHHLDKYIIPFDKHSLRDVVYTYQIGREAMDYRLALVVSNLSELSNKLNWFSKGNLPNDEFFTGNAKENYSERSRSKMDELLQMQDLEKIAEAWVGGEESDWKKLYPVATPQKVPLATYPFVRNSYWIEANEPSTSSPIHPLIDKNESTFKNYKFSKTFTGREYYLMDHRINGKKILPGVLYMNMALAGVKLASENDYNRIKGLVWESALEVSDEDSEVYIQLTPGNEDVAFEIYKVIEKEKQTYAYGNILLTRNDSASDSMDINEIRRRCHESASSTECYRSFQQIGIHYGDKFKPIEEIYYNATEALSKLRISKEDMSLNTSVSPSLIDGAIQTVSGLMGLDGKKEPKLYMPFSIGEVKILERTPSNNNYYAYVKKSILSTLNDSNVISFTILILDEEGKIIVEIIDFSIRLAHPLPIEKSIKEIAVTNASSDSAIGESLSDAEIIDLLHKVERGELKAWEVDKLLGDHYEPTN